MTPETPAMRLKLSVSKTWRRLSKMSFGTSSAELLPEACPVPLYGGVEMELRRLPSRHQLTEVKGIAY